MPEPLSRLLENAESRPLDATIEAAAAQLLMKIEPPQIPTFAEFARIQGVLDAAVLSPKRRAHSVWRIGVVAASLLISVQAGWALMQSNLSAPVRQWVAAVLERPRATSRVGTLTQPLPPSVVASPPVPLSPPSATPNPPSGTPASNQVVLKHAAKVVPPRPTPLAIEAAQLALAQQALNQDPSQSLALLADYRRRFPHGALSREVDLTGLSANLMLGRSQDALLILDHFAENDFAAVQRAPELRVLRAELLAGSHRFNEAQRAFDQALAIDLNAPLRERALYGRAACLEGLGNVAESRGGNR